ncbi:MAG: SRPBCC family protein [Mycobacteriales bacterium]
MSRSRSFNALVLASPTEVWRSLGDFSRVSNWASGVDHSSALTSPETGVGAVRRVQVGRETLRERITCWEPERELAYDITGLPRVVQHVENRWTLVPEGTGTRVTLTSSVTTRPPVLSRAVLRRVSGVSAGLVADLAAHYRAQEIAR